MPRRGRHVLIYQRRYRGGLWGWDGSNDVSVTINSILGCNLLLPEGWTNGTQTFRVSPHIRTCERMHIYVGRNSSSSRTKSFTVPAIFCMERTWNCIYRIHLELKSVPFQNGTQLQELYSSDCSSKRTVSALCEHYTGVLGGNFCASIGQ